MKDFFYDELNKELEINANLDEDAGTISGTLTNDSNSQLTGNLNESQDITECIYGKLNNLVELQEYKGWTSETIEVIVDNKYHIIKANLFTASFASKEYVDEKIKILRQYTDEQLNKVNVNIDNLVLKTDETNRQVNQIKLDLSSLDEALQKEIKDRTNAINTEATTRKEEDDKLAQSISDETNARIEQDTVLLNSINSEIEERNKADASLQDKIDKESATRKTADQALQSGIDSNLEKINQEIQDRTNSDNTLQSNIDNLSNTKLDISNADRNVMTELSVDTNGDNVYLNKDYINLKTLTTSNNQNQIELATKTQAGLMSMSDYSTLYDLKDRVADLESKTTRLLYTEKTNPTAEDINNFVIGLGYIKPFSGVAVVVDKTYHIWHYYENDNIGWQDDGLDTVNTFTNTNAGIIKGAEVDGKVYAETDGTGSVFGWGSLKGRVSTNETNITSLQTDLQSEITNRENADNALSERITTNSNNLITETNERKSADENLQSQITQNKTDISDEITNRQAADKTLQDNIDTNTQSITTINNTLKTYGNIVAHNVNEFATAEQGSKADSALQPKDNITELTNNAGYTKVESSTTNGNIKIDGNETVVYNDTNIKSDITDLQNNKVDKVEGKQLSTNDFTNDYKSQVEANTTARHTHTNKAILDTITETLINSWNDKVSQTQLTTELNKKQDKLISGTNIKTLNNESLLGEGNIDITSAQWGNITGDLSNQTDLKNALNEKANNSTVESLTTQVNINTTNISTNTTDISGLKTSKLDASKANVNVMTGLGVTAQNDNVSLNKSYKNLSTQATSSDSVNVPLANDTTAGLMSKADYAQIRDNTARIEQLEGQNIRLLYTASDNPTASQIEAFVKAEGYTDTTQWSQIGVIVSGTNHIWRYYTNTTTWTDIGVDTVNQFTNSIAGIIKGSATNGKVYAETDGTGSVYGWDDLNTKVTNNTSAIETEIANRTSADETLQSNINNKLDKTTDAGYRVYVSNNKVNSTVAYSSNANVNSVVYRDANGRSKIQDPAAELDIANKKYVDGLVATEISNRETSDSSLQEQINKLSQDLSTETTNRTNSDTTLQSNINTVSSNLSGEISNRETADTNLQTQITTNKTNISSNKTEINGLKTSLATTNANVTKNADHIRTNASDIFIINDKIPTQASSTNQLADKDFVNSSINNIAAFYITSNASGDAFESYAQLSTATVFYSGGQSRTPTRNDYCIVRKDENHNNATTRYIYQGSQWEFQYIVNDSPFTATQLSAINSGITSSLVTKLNGIETGAQANTVTSVNNKTGAVNLTASDVGALPSSTTIPTVNNGKLTIRKNGTDVGSFTANQSSDKIVNITVPTTASDVGALPDTTDYLKSATVSNNELIIVKQDDTSITFQGGGVTLRRWS